MTIGPLKRFSRARSQCTVTYSEDEAAKAEALALEKLGKELRLPGFRPGKAPADLVREQTDPADLLEETIRNLLPRTFQDIVQEHTLHPILPPKVEVTSRQPLSLTITLVEMPQVTLRRIEEIKIPKQEPRADEKDVDRMVQHLVAQYRKSEGGTAVFDDAFVRKHGLGESAASLRTRIRESMVQEEERIERARRENALFEAIEKAVVVDLPEECIDAELQSLLDRFSGQLQERKMTIEAWLRQAKKSTADLSKEMRADASRRLRLRLGVEKLLEEKKIAVPAGEGADTDEQALWQKRVEKLVETMLA